GGGWIRTSVGVSQQIYSLPPLATRALLRSAAGDYAMEIRHCSSAPTAPPHQAIAASPCCASQALVAPKWPQPRKGSGPRRADSGEGWLAISTWWRGPIR